MPNSPYGLTKAIVKQTPREVYNDALQAYVDNVTYTAPDGSKYKGEALKNYLEAVVQGEKQTNPQKGTGIMDSGKNKATVKTLGTKQIKNR